MDVVPDLLPKADRRTICLQVSCHAGSLFRSGIGRRSVVMIGELTADCGLALGECDELECCIVQKDRPPWTCEIYSNDDLHGC